MLPSVGRGGRVWVNAHADQPPPHVVAGETIQVGSPPCVRLLDTRMMDSCSLSLYPSITPRLLTGRLDEPTTPHTNDILSTNDTSDVVVPAEAMPQSGFSVVQRVVVAESQKVPPRIRLLSLRTLSTSRAVSLEYTTTSTRGKPLVRQQFVELLYHAADIYCLQDLDPLDTKEISFLQQQGYEVHTCQRSQERGLHRECVAVLFRRDRFTIVHVVPIYFNHAIETPKESSNPLSSEDIGIEKIGEEGIDNPNQKYLSRGGNSSSIYYEKCCTDDVALLVMIRPHNTAEDIPTGLCVVSAQFPEDSRLEDVRRIHATYLAQQIQRLNHEFHWPVVICANLNDRPASPAYLVLRTGRVPVLPKAPACSTDVSVEPVSRATMSVRWLPPKLAPADPPILYYTVSWRSGGSTALGFYNEKSAPAGDCVRYDTIVDSKRNPRVVAKKHLQMHITGLASGVAYEFRVTAVNAVGVGEPSLPSQPVQLINPISAPELPPLREFLEFEKVVAQTELQRREDQSTPMVLLNTEADTDLLHAETALTPRDIDGNVAHYLPRVRVFPVDSNPRSGWSGSLGGQPDPNLARELAREYIISNSVLRTYSGFKDPNINTYDDCGVTSAARLQWEQRVQTTGFGQLDTTNSGAATFILDGREAVRHIGAPNQRDAHNLLLRSAYENFGAGAEPQYTTIHPVLGDDHGTECMDYIFYSAGGGLIADRVLSFPRLQSSNLSEAPEAPYTSIDIGSREELNPFFQLSEEPLKQFVTTLNINRENLFQREYTAKDVQSIKSSLKARLALDREIVPEMMQKTSIPAYTPPLERGEEKSLPLTQCHFWGGRLQEAPVRNVTRANYFLPQIGHAAQHIPLGVELLIDTTQVATCWQGT